MVIGWLCQLLGCRATGSQISGEGRVAPPETTSAGTDTRAGNMKRVLKIFERSTSPRTTTRRSPKRDIERVEIEDPTEKRNATH